MLGAVKTGLFIFIISLLVLPPVVADEGESLGQFRISEFSVSPRLRMNEPGQSGFEIKQTWLGFEWLKDQSLRGQMWLGSQELSQPAVWFSPTLRPDFGMEEAWLEGRNQYGILRAGLLNVHQGFEGVNPEWSWIMPESRVRRQGWLIKRDFGVQLSWLTQPVMTEFTIHNGEAGANHDGKMWYSGLWQVKSSRGYGMLISASVGNTKQESTKDSVANTSYNLPFSPTESAKIRYAMLSIFRETERRLLLIEAGQGDILQNENKNSFAWGRADLSLNIYSDLYLLLRYERSQADLKNTQSIINSSSYGFSVISDDRLQSFTAFGVHNEEDPRVQNDEYFLIFRLNSRYIP